MDHTNDQVYRAICVSTLEEGRRLIGRLAEPFFGEVPNATGRVFLTKDMARAAVEQVTFHLPDYTYSEIINWLNEPILKGHRKSRLGAKWMWSEVIHQVTPDKAGYYYSATIGRGEEFATETSCVDGYTDVRPNRASVFELHPGLKEEGWRILEFKAERTGR